jgi:hypothetical protein
LDGEGIGEEPFITEPHKLYGENPGYITKTDAISETFRILPAQPSNMTPDGGI